MFGRKRKNNPPRSSGAYVVTGEDKVEEIEGVPQSSLGAPCPHVICGEQEVFLIYLAQEHSDKANGEKVRIVDGSSEEPVVTIQFIEPYAHYLGPPNDESLRGHPLVERGLTPYSCSKVQSSSWIAALEKMNSVHPCHRKESFDGIGHYIFTFHDSVFECVADAFVVLTHERTTIRKAIDNILYLVS